MKTRSLTLAQVDFVDGEPQSREYGDIYFSRQNGLAESRHVFIDRNRLPARFAAARRDHRVVETGFGTGLNFLACAECWLQHADDSLCLDYLSFERHPLSQSDLQYALENWPELAPLAQELIGHYGEPTPGYRRWQLFGGRVRLTLVVDDIRQALPELAQHGHGQVDSWLLDGFAPAKNPDMWETVLYQQMARLSAPDARFATFTAAGYVRRGLQAQGFEVEKCAGFGAKREMLCGVFQGAEGVDYKLKDKPWFIHASAPDARPRGDRRQHHWLVIGGGLAGCLSARALADRGYRVTLIERGSDIATLGSGNRAGVIFPGFSPHDSAQYRYYQYSFLTALQRIGQLLGPGDGRHWSDCGVLVMATDDKERRQQAELVASGVWPQSLFQPFDADSASELAGTRLKAGGLFFPRAGWLQPSALCRAALDHPGIECLLHTRAGSLKEIAGERWRVEGKQNREAWSLEADGVIVANAGDAADLLSPLTVPLPLKAIRGQISQPAQSVQSKPLATVVCHQGYITPSLGGRHEVGATFNLKDDCPDLRGEDHAHNLQALETWLPELGQSLQQRTETLAGRVGFRWQTPDYLPMVGPLPRVEAQRQQYRALAGGMKHEPLTLPEYHPGLYLNVAHGSRGITSACLAADILASSIDGGLFPVDQPTLAAVHPARFLIRAIKRRQLKAP
ncbi:MAG: bifunctional tRNA (5-methylaminomethyl-2-thiouridine)(34)-methyltransferase MnmD/FAD-dependent 5-carboxymethylaminomethyl-2-thiouridine(34) oxidoreductase MnmC [Pseudomonadota bacterium]